MQMPPRSSITEPKNAAASSSSQRATASQAQPLHVPSGIWSTSAGIALAADIQKPAAASPASSQPSPTAARLLQHLQRLLARHVVRGGARRRADALSRRRAAQRQHAVGGGWGGEEWGRGGEAG